MRVYIMTDLEAATGACWGCYGLSPTCEGQRALRLMSTNINAAITGARAGGADEVHVYEVGHHPFVHDVITEPYTRTTDVFGVREYDAVMFVGQHSPAGRPDGVLSHCSCSKTVRYYRVNGHDVGEMGLFAGFAGHFGVPTVMVSGDNSVAREALDLIGDTEIAQVSQALGNHTIVTHSAAGAAKLIREKASQGVRRAAEILPMRLEPPLRVEYQLAYPAIAASIARLPGVRLKDATTVEHESRNWLEVHETFHAMVMAQQFWDSRM